MLFRILTIFLVISVILVSGCVTQGPKETVGEVGATGATLEDQATEIVEQEMEQAIENISIEDIENSLVK